MAREKIRTGWAKGAWSKQTGNGPDDLKLCLVSAVSWAESQTYGNSYSTTGYNREPLSYNDGTTPLMKRLFNWFMVRYNKKPYEFNDGEGITQEDVELELKKFEHFYDRTGVPKIAEERRKEIKAA